MLKFVVLIPLKYSLCMYSYSTGASNFSPNIHVEGLVKAKTDIF